MKILKIKKAFTLIELIFVIVIFAIISMFGADLYTRIYESYVQTRAMNQLEARTANVLNIISSRLEDRVRGTVIGRVSGTNAYVPIMLVQTQHDILEWLGQSVESRNLVPTAAGGAASSIGWSGFADLASMAAYVGPTKAAGARFSFNTQGSNINQAAAVINTIKGNNNFGIIFRNINADPLLQNAFGFAADNSATKIATAAVGAANDNISVISYTGEPNRLTGNLQIDVSEQYYLVHSAYAIVPVNVGNHPQGGQVFDLELRYNYEPWNGVNYNGNNTARAILARDVSLFRFKDDNGAVAMKLCMRDNGRNINPQQLDLIVCKSQVVF